MPILDTLITDRTQADVDALIVELKAGNNPADSHKGSYNGSDLNRVGEAINYVKKRLYGIGITGAAYNWDEQYTMDSPATIRCFQPGYGTPSPENVRPIGTDCYIDGIGFVYGGTVDADTNTLTVSYAARTFDGSENWVEQANVTTAYVTQSDIDKTQSINDENTKCDTFKKSTGGTSDPGILFGFASNTNYRVFLRHYRDLAGVSDIEGLKTFLSENPVTCVYKLEVPVTYNLTAHQMEQAVRCLATRDVELVPDAKMKTDWSALDIPTKSKMQKYLSAVHEIMDSVAEYSQQLALPDEMRNLDYNGANNIELVLIQTDEAVSNVEKSPSGISGRQISGVNCLQ